MSTVDYVKASSSVRPLFDVHGVRVFIKTRLPKNIDTQELKSQIAEKLPSVLFSDIEKIFIGDFEYLKNRGATAISYEKNIFLTNLQDDVADVVDDIAHELGHSVEKKFFHNIHKNPLLKQEFLSKKKIALGMLDRMGHDVSKSLLVGPSHDKTIDQILTSDIGLHNIEKTFANLVVTPYSLISLSEYFSEGLQFFLLNDAFYLQSVCPVLYNVIETILYSEA